MMMSRGQVVVAVLIMPQPQSSLKTKGTVFCNHVSDTPAPRNLKQLMRCSKQNKYKVLRLKVNGIHNKNEKADINEDGCTNRNCHFFVPSCYNLPSEVSQLLICTMRPLKKKTLRQISISLPSPFFFSIAAAYYCAVFCASMKTFPKQTLSFVNVF